MSTKLQRKVKAQKASVQPWADSSVEAIKAWDIAEGIDK